jgi:hypothetical protein
VLYRTSKGTAMVVAWRWVPLLVRWMEDAPRKVYLSDACYSLAARAGVGGLLGEPHAPVPRRHGRWGGCRVAGGPVRAPVPGRRTAALTTRLHRVTGARCRPAGPFVSCERDGTPRAARLAAGGRGVASTQSALTNVSLQLAREIAVSFMY